MASLASSTSTTIMATPGGLPAPPLTPSSPTSPSTPLTQSLRKRREPSPLPERYVVLKSQKAKVNSTSSEKRGRSKKYPSIKRTGYSSDTSSRMIDRKRKTDEAATVAVDPPAKREQLSVSDGEAISNELEAARLRLKQKIAALRAARSKKRNASRTTTARATSASDAATADAAIIKDTGDDETSSPKLTESTCDGSTTAREVSGAAAQVAPVKSATIAEEAPAADDKEPVTNSTPETADRTAAVKKSVFLSGRPYLLGHGLFAERQPALPFYHPPGTVMERLVWRMRFESASSSDTLAANKILASTLDSAGHEVTCVEKANTSATTSDAILASTFDSAAGHEVKGAVKANTSTTTSTASATAVSLGVGIAASSQYDETGVTKLSTASQMLPADRTGLSDDAASGSTCQVILNPAASEYCSPEKTVHVGDVTAEAIACEIQKPGDATSGEKLATREFTAAVALEAPSPSTSTSDDTAVDHAEEPVVLTTTVKAIAAGEQVAQVGSKITPAHAVPLLMIPTSVNVTLPTAAPNAEMVTSRASSWTSEPASHAMLPIASSPVTLEIVSSFATPTAALSSSANIGTPAPSNSSDLSFPTSGFVEHVPMLHRPDTLQYLGTYAVTVASGYAAMGTSSMELEEPSFTTMGAVHNPCESAGITDLLPHSQVVFGSYQASVAVANASSEWDAPTPSLPTPSTYGYQQPMPEWQTISASASGDTASHFTSSASMVGDAAQPMYMSSISQDWDAGDQVAGNAYHCAANSASFGSNGSGLVPTFSVASITPNDMDLDEDSNRPGGAQNQFGSLDAGFLSSGSAGAGILSSAFGSVSHTVLQPEAFMLSTPMVAGTSEQLEPHWDVQEAVMPISISNYFSLPAPPGSTTAQEEAPPMTLLEIPDMPQSNALQNLPTATHPTTALSQAASTLTLHESSLTSQLGEQLMTLVPPNSPTPLPGPETTTTEPVALDEAAMTAFISSENCTAAVPFVSIGDAVAPVPANSVRVDSAAAVAVPAATDVLRKTKNIEFNADARGNSLASEYDDDEDGWSLDGSDDEDEGRQDVNEVEEILVVERLRDRSDLLGSLAGLIKNGFSLPPVRTDGDEIDDFADFFSSFRVGSGDKAGKEEDEKDAAVPAQGSSAKSGHILLDDDEEEECDL
ncbi:hypothetical protein HDU96_009192 [Phlyctochytrium bullatum]|nr:hypothetical protein HDU96_009192 [Phlyctochytrium bullatum]